MAWIIIVGALFLVFVLFNEYFRYLNRAGPPVLSDVGEPVLRRAVEVLLDQSRRDTVLCIRTPEEGLELDMSLVRVGHDCQPAEVDLAWRATREGASALRRVRDRLKESGYMADIREEESWEMLVVTGVSDRRLMSDVAAATGSERFTLWLEGEVDAVRAIRGALRVGSGTAGE